MWVHYGSKRTILIKLLNGWYSCGDHLFEDFDESDSKSMQELKELLERDYDGIETLIMDLIKPDQKLGRHAFDVRTMTCPDGSVQVTSCNFQGACSDYYSWSS